jgi:hypothetical protein
MARVANSAKPMSRRLGQHRDGCRLAQLVALERSLIDHHRKRLRRLRRTSGGQQPDDIEYVERQQRADNAEHDQRGLQQRPCNAREPLHGAGSVNASRLVKIGWIRVGPASIISAVKGNQRQN